MQLPGRPGLGGYWGVSSFSVVPCIKYLLIHPGMDCEGLISLLYAAAVLSSVLVGDVIGYA